MVFRDGGVQNQREIAATGRAKARNETVKSELKGLGRTFHMAILGTFGFPADPYATEGSWYESIPTPVR